MLDTITELMDLYFTPEPPETPNLVPLSWERALLLAAEKRYDVLPACYQINLRQVASTHSIGIRNALSRLTTEYPQGWLASNEDRLDAEKPLPQQPLHYWIPVNGGPKFHKF